MMALFVMRYAVPVHSWRDLAHALIRRGHEVTIFFDRQYAEMQKEKQEMIEALVQESKGNFTHEWARHRTDWRRRLVFPERQLAGWRRFFFVRQSRFFQDRWMNLFPSWLRFLLKIPGAKLFFKSGLGGNLLRFIEKITPPDSGMREQIRKAHPDILIVPIANMRYGSVDTDYLKAGRSLGIPIAGIAFSWDSVAAKGLFQPVPDIMFVWNRAQVREAMEHHSVPSERIRIIGAPPFDKWFGHGMRETPREEFCKAHGLRSKDPIVLYLGASKNVAADETHVIRELREAFNRVSDARLQKTQIIARPHPAHTEIYESLDARDAIVLPAGGQALDQKEKMQLFYDCAYHAVVATGVYTSAMMDAVLANRPVAALVRKEYTQTQEEAEYYRALRESGAISAAESHEKFFEIMRSLMEGRDERAPARARFIETHIRPHGRGIPAAEQFVRELELFFTSRQHPSEPMARFLDSL